MRTQMIVKETAKKIAAFWAKSETIEWVSDTFNISIAQANHYYQAAMNYLVPDDEEEVEVGEEMWLHLFEFARMVPVSLSTKKRIDVMSLPIIKGLDVNAKTAQEVAAEKGNALFVDAMAQKQ